MLDRTTLLMRAVFSDVVDVLRGGEERDTKSVLISALFNTDWSYFNGLSEEDLCEHGGHDYESSCDGQECYNCGSPRR